MPLYLDPSGNSLGTYTCDYSQVDISKAGNYKAYYTFTAIDNEGIKTYYVGRDIIVEPTTTFEDGATYSGSKVIDVEGGSVTINGEDFFIIVWAEVTSTIWTVYCGFALS